MTRQMDEASTPTASNTAYLLVLEKTRQALLRWTCGAGLLKHPPRAEAPGEAPAALLEAARRATTAETLAGGSPIGLPQQKLTSRGAERRNDGPRQGACRPKAQGGGHALRLDRRTHQRGDGVRITTGALLEKYASDPPSPGKSQRERRWAPPTAAARKNRKPRTLAEKRLAADRATCPVAEEASADVVVAAG